MSVHTRREESSCVAMVASIYLECFASLRVTCTLKTRQDASGHLFEAAERHNSYTHALCMSFVGRRDREEEADESMSREAESL